MSLSSVTIRDLLPTDAERIALLLNNKKIWDGLRDYLPHPYHLVHATDFLETVGKQNPTENKAIVNDGLLVGICGFHPMKDVYHGTCEIGYWIGEPYWGKGIATRAIALLVEYGTRTFDCVRVEAQVFEINPASARVLEKNGFIHEATMKKRVTKNGVVMDALLYALFPAEVQ